MWDKQKENLLHKSFVVAWGAQKLTTGKAVIGRPHDALVTNGHFPSPFHADLVYCTFESGNIHETNEKRTVCTRILSLSGEHKTHLWGGCKNSACSRPNMTLLMHMAISFQISVQNSSAGYLGEWSHTSKMKRASFVQELLHHCAEPQSATRMWCCQWNEIGDFHIDELMTSAWHLLWTSSCRLCDIHIILYSSE
jgi:hypothetical protein